MVQILYPNELQTPELTLEFLDYAPHQILREPTYHFLMRVPHVQAPVGRMNLRDSNAPLIVLYAGHVGYEVDEDYRGHGLAARGVEMLKPMARRLGLNPLWITSNIGNTASRRTSERAGATFVEVIDVPPGNIIYEAGVRQKARYRIDL